MVSEGSHDWKGWGRARTLRRASFLLWTLGSKIMYIIVLPDSPKRTPFQSIFEAPFRVSFPIFQPLRPEGAGRSPERMS
jgi:hypothetical protein